MKKILLLLLLSACSGSSTTKTGFITKDGVRSFNPCSDRPNCVSSFSKAEDKDHYIRPIKIIKGKENAYKKLEKVLSNFSEAKILKKESDYIHAVFNSSLFKFKDDVEFLIEEDKIHVKSASRTGYSDLGANRKRVEAIRFKFHQSAL